MKFMHTLSRETGFLWLVEWYPEDWDAKRKPCKSYCVASDMNSAAALYSHLMGDIRSVTRVANGGVLIDPAVINQDAARFFQGGDPLPNFEPTAELKVVGTNVS